MLAASCAIRAASCGDSPPREARQPVLLERVAPRGGIGDARQEAEVGACFRRKMMQRDARAERVEERRALDAFARHRDDREIDVGEARERLEKGAEAHRQPVAAAGGQHRRDEERAGFSPQRHCVRPVGRV